MGGGRGKRFGLGNRGRKKNKKEVSRNHVEKEKKIKDKKEVSRINFTPPSPS